MRLACLHLPAFPLQSAVRQDPTLIGRAVIVVVGDGKAAQVAACSRAAYETGIRPGMSPSQARIRKADLSVVAGSPVSWRTEIIALAEELRALLPPIDDGGMAALAPPVGADRRIDLSEALGVEPVPRPSRAPQMQGAGGSRNRSVVDLHEDFGGTSNAADGARSRFWGRLGGAMHHADLFLQVPSGQRSQRFGRRVLDVVEARGFRGRVGIAADRFTATAAARMRGSSPLMVVSRGEAAAFLSPLPIDLLPLRDEVRALLRAAGVHTLGDFAALPPPSVECRAAGAIDYQSLARGLGPNASPMLDDRRPAPSRSAA